MTYYFFYIKILLNAIETHIVNGWKNKITGVDSSLVSTRRRISQGAAFFLLLEYYAQKGMEQRD